MTETAKAKVSLIDEFKSLNIKQVIAIVGALVIAVVLQTYGFAEQCMGFLIIAAVLYMVPHILKVTSVRIKAIIGVVFVVIVLFTSMFISAPMSLDKGTHMIDSSQKTFGGMDYTDNGDGTVTVTADIYVEDYDKAFISYSEVQSLRVNTFVPSSTEKHDMAITPVVGDEKVKARASYTAELIPEAIVGYILQLDQKHLDEEGNEVKSSTALAFLVDTGCSSSYLHQKALSGLGLYIALTAAMFFMILIFSALMRRSAEKTRVKMEADGRLYPKGYGTCKECGGMVLPGEVTCRKCGAYIDVPEELRAHKKDYFVCEKCGAEVPNDATYCPKCGAHFDGVENEVEHSDGTVDVSEETFECSECGAEVPINATRCPKCGATFDDEEGESKE